MKKVIQVFKPRFRTDEVLAEIRECLERGWTGLGYKTALFEEEWKKYTGFSNAHFLNSATSGLHLAVRILKDEYGWNDGDEIITTSFTFVSTNHAILYENMVPVFADVDDSLCLSPDSIEEAISSKTRAVIYVGIGGNAANYRQIRDICRKHNLILILDAAHMAGTRWTESADQVGLDSDCAVFSFQAVKNCPSADAGMICFKESAFDSKARQLSWLGIDKTTYDRYSKGSYKWRYDINEVGFKYHGNSVMAAICLVSLRYLDEDNKYRRMIASYYGKALASIPSVQPVKHSQDVISSRHLYQIVTESRELRDALLDKLASNGICCGVHYLANTSYAPYKKCRNLAALSQFFSDRIISLPLHLEISKEDVDRIVGIIGL